MFDFHMHSRVSFDGHASGLEMALAAKRVGLQEICFTDHRDFDPEGVMQNIAFSFDEYSAEYDDLQIPGLVIRRGMEFGLLPDNQDRFTRDLQKREFDFVLGSVHFVDGKDVYYQDYWEGKTVFQAERRFLEQTLECVQVHTDFDVLAHLTYIGKTTAHPTKTFLRYEAHQQLIDEILMELVRKGKGLEVNTSGVDRCGGLLPTADIVARFKELGGKIVTVGSDAHTSDRVGQYSFEVCRMLRDIFGYVCTFEGREPVFHQL
jgi:histidinol-phosphatase (PHP family)